jgi:hypothetical protein
MTIIIKKTHENEFRAGYGLVLPPGTSTNMYFQNDIDECYGIFDYRVVSSPANSEIDVSTRYMQAFKLIDHGTDYSDGFVLLDEGAVLTIGMFYGGTARQLRLNIKNDDATYDFAGKIHIRFYAPNTSFVRIS